MDYSQAIEYIHGAGRFGSKLGLENINKLLSLMGNPHLNLEYVHVAGTNGKGSTVAFISNILIEAGYKVGTFTSPYIENFNERIKINYNNISDDDVATVTDYVKSKIDIMLKNGENHPTEFEIITATAFYYFFKNQCDIVVLETGLGGRFDATNVIKTSKVAVITSIGYDHTERLGNTLEKIAFEKAGIIKKHSRVILYSQNKNVESVFLNTANLVDAKVLKVSFDDIEIKKFNETGQTFCYKNYKDLKISLIGDHQYKNAVMAINSCESLKDMGFNKIGRHSMYTGLKNTKWPGRLECLGKDPLIFIDGAHNESGAKVLSDTLNKYFPHKNKIFIIGILSDKNYEAIIKHIYKDAKHFFTITPNSYRALDAKELANNIKKYTSNVTACESIRDAITKAYKSSKKDDLICAFGSLYYIGEVKRIIDNKDHFTVLKD